ncbi:hypothetical protein M0R89_16080 [Halorussus limi]|uniref:Uncharacterized protein n=1 Tax=Halorussus limi TaxID=2938695 RepID=A0A8U0HTQ0_9EURY|nr:hypothetical protein [Halorussus limi]UPV74044.1 hypothetical protein M0R89_16080 [Halorussus limi]
MKQSTLALLAVATAFVLGTVVGSAGGLGLRVGGDTDTSDFESPGFSLSKATGSCDGIDSDSGWVHDVAVGESFAVTLEATVVHDRNRTVTANVTHVAPGNYVVDLRTVPSDRADARRKKANASAGSVPDCASTRLSLGTSLPTDYEQFTVAMNGRTIRTVEYDGTVADLHRLPNPINATDR